MADISAEIAAFKGAVYGEEVRDSLVALANKLNGIIESNVSDWTVDPIALSSNDDLNSLRNGRYFFRSGLGYPSNIPEESNGSVLCFGQKTNDYRCQILINYLKHIWFRCGSSDSNWSSWIEITSMQNPIAKNILSITETDDCDNIGLGWFSYSSSYPANHPPLNPYSNNTVIASIGSNNLSVQIAYNRAYEYYIRSYQQTYGWSNWKKIATIENLFYTDNENPNLLDIWFEEANASSSLIIKQGPFGVLTINGSTTDAKIINLVRPLQIESGTYTFGFDKDYTDYGISLQIRNSNINGTDDGNKAYTSNLGYFSYSSNAYILVRIYLGANKTFNNVIVKPFLYKGSPKGYNVFKPYRLTRDYVLDSMFNEFNKSMNINKHDCLFELRKKFIFSAIGSDDENQIFYFINSSITTRCSVINITFSEKHTLTLTNPLYVFRLYWFDDSGTLCSTAWDSIWEVPANVNLSIVIKPRNSSDSFSFDDFPQYYLLDNDFNTEPKPYFKTEIDTTIEEIKNANTEPGLMFLLSTDHHNLSVQGTIYKRNTVSDMVINMNAIVDNFNIDAHICLGDLVDMKWASDSSMANYGFHDLTASEVDTIFKDQLDYTLKEIRKVKVPLLLVAGNHDDNRYINRDTIKESPSQYDFSKNELFSKMISYVDLRNVPNLNNNGLDYYVDWPNYKIRMFALHSSIYYTSNSRYPHTYNDAWWYGYSDETRNWFANELDNIPQGWSVLLISHESPYFHHNGENVCYPNMGPNEDQSNDQSEQINNIENDIENFINNGGDFIGCLYGHSHCDWHSTTPWLDISFDSQKCYDYSPSLEHMPNAIHNSRTAGTATEDCWNIVIIQPISRKIKIIRFGAGNNAEYSY